MATQVEIVDKRSGWVFDPLMGREMQGRAKTQAQVLGRA